MTTPSDLGATSICRDRLDRLKPCCYIAHCHEPRQSLHHKYGLRGRDCWAYVLLSQKILPPEAA